MLLVVVTVNGRNDRTVVNGEAFWLTATRGGNSWLVGGSRLSCCLQRVEMGAYEDPTAPDVDDYRRARLTMSDNIATRRTSEALQSVRKESLDNTK